MGFDKACKINLLANTQTLTLLHQISSMNIALVTYQDRGTYYRDSVQNEDQLLINFLNAKGLRTEKKIWNDPSVNWNLFDLIIIKSPWDYFNHITQFYTWISELEATDVRVLNPLSIVKWNADKHYLQDIAEKGLKTTPSIFLEKGKDFNLGEYFERFNSEKIIVKPTVSGGSKHTFKVEKINLSEISEQLTPLITNESFIVQPFLKEIEEQGEWSFIFFGGEFSHAILKKARAGDFRVQSAFGGTVHPQTPPHELLSVAKAYVDRFANQCLYARVDGTIVNEEFVLMELELIEPFLFLESEKHLENYYRALQRLIAI